MCRDVVGVDLHDCSTERLLGSKDTSRVFLRDGFRRHRHRVPDEPLDLAKKVVGALTGVLEHLSHRFAEAVAPVREVLEHLDHGHFDRGPFLIGPVVERLALVDPHPVQTGTDVVGLDRGLGPLDA